MGPLMTVATKIRCRVELRAQGYGRRQINEMIDAIDDDLVSVAITEAKVSPPVGVVGAIGDGTIINAILEWLKSPQGQAFIDVLLKLLLGLLVL